MGRVWVRSAAIRPVPGFAQLPIVALAEVEEWLGDDEVTTEVRLSELYDDFERHQPIIADRVGRALSRESDEVAVALGYFLTLVMYRAFRATFGDGLLLVDGTALASVEEALALDEQLRGADPTEGLDSDDIIAMEQPHAVSYVHEHVDVALEVHAAAVDVDAVYNMYRMVLVEVLALSYAVRAPAGHEAHTSEIHA